MISEISKSSTKSNIMDVLRFGGSINEANELLERYQQKEEVAIRKPKLINFAWSDRCLSKATDEVAQLLGGVNGSERKFINCFLTNLVGNIANNAPAPTAVSTKHSIKNKDFSVEVQSRILAKMVQAEFLRRFDSSRKAHLAASYVPTMQLTHIINNNYDDIGRLRVSVPSMREITINCRDVTDKNSPDDKRTMTARLFPEVKGLRANLVAINEFIQKQPFQQRVRTALPSEIVGKANNGYCIRENILSSAHMEGLYQVGDGYSYLTTPNTILKRSFNLVGGEALGGRFYGKGEGHYLGLKREIRKDDILLDGEPMIEADIDFSHLGIAYGLVGSPPPKNPYIYDKGLVEREIMKSLGLVALNESRPDYRLATLSNLIEKAMDGRIPLDAVSFFTENYVKLKGDFLKHNQPIAHMFGQGAVYRLLRVESDIMERSMLALIQMGVSFLPVHDALRVRRGEGNCVAEVISCLSMNYLKHHLSVTA